MDDIQDCKKHGGSFAGGLSSANDTGALNKMTELFKKQKESLLEEIEILKTENLRLERVKTEKVDKFDILEKEADEATTKFNSFRVDCILIISNLCDFQKDNDALRVEIEILKKHLQENKETI